MNARWSQAKVEVIYAPQTGSTKPWEIWGVFPGLRTHWSSCKTEEAANKLAERKRANIQKPDFIEACKKAGVW